MTGFAGARGRTELLFYVVERSGFGNSGKFGCLFRELGHLGLEIVGLDYERIATAETAKKNLGRLQARYGINYALLFAGSTDKQNKDKSLPMLNAIITIGRRSIWLFPPAFEFQNIHKHSQ